jgi:holo-[acyl-carrier protein] synthase
MRVVAHGIDMVDCARLARSIEQHGQKFLQRVFTPAELEYCCGRKREIEHLAGRFAAKEAVLKVLGTGWREGIAWTDIEIRNEPSGAPRVTLTGRCREVADQLNLCSILISISHIETHAIASAIGQREDSGGALGIGD